MLPPLPIPGFAHCDLFHMAQRRIVAVHLGFPSRVTNRSAWLQAILAVKLPFMEQFHRQFGRPMASGGFEMGFQVAIQAHRGSPDPSLGIAENTLPAFARSRQLGADGIELDVRLTADGALAVHHDATIPGIGNVADLEVRALPDQVPLLAEVLRAMPDLTVNIEVRNLPTESSHDPEEAVARAVANTIADTQRGAGTVVSSFWPPSLDGHGGLRC
jgi:hypothetical protein